MNFEQFSTIKDLQNYLKSIGVANTYKETHHWASEHIPKEKHYQAKILAYLRSLLKSGIIEGYVWKDQASTYQSAGFPDVSIVTAGKYFGFEVKRPLLGSTSELQKETIEKLRAGGGIVEVVSYVSEVERILRENGVLKEGDISGAQ